MDIDIKIVTAVIGVIGVIAGTLMGSLLSGFGHILKSRSEAKKVINQNIFNLFQMWHLVAIFEKVSIDNLSELYIKKIKEHLSNDVIPENQDTEFKNFCAYILTQILNSVFKKIDTPFKDQYFKAVLELAKFSPVMAHDLSNNRYTNELLNQCDEFYQSIYNQNISTDPSEEEIKFYNDFYFGMIAGKEWATKDFSRDLQRDILKLSWKSGIRTWVSSIFKIRKRRIKLQDKKIKEFLDKYIQEVVKPLINKGSNSSTENLVK
jgi:hypothetical protein